MSAFDSETNPFDRQQGGDLQHSEKERGSIEAGKLADIVVIDRDYLACAEDEIRSDACPRSVSACGGEPQDHFFTSL